MTDFLFSFEQKRNNILLASCLTQTHRFNLRTDNNHSRSDNKHRRSDNKHRRTDNKHRRRDSNHRRRDSNSHNHIPPNHQKRENEDFNAQISRNSSI